MRRPLLAATVFALLVLVSCPVQAGGPSQLRDDLPGDPGAWEPVLLPSPPPPFVAPEPRLLHTAILDPVGQRVLVFGGVNDVRTFDSVWSLDLTGAPSWSRIATPTSPVARRDHSAIYDPVRHRMIVFGGTDFYGNTLMNDLFALSLDGTPTWSPIVTSGVAHPAGRMAHTAIYDPVRDRMIVFGGYSGTFTSDVWALSLSGTPSWAKLGPAGTLPAGRNAAAAVYDPVGDRMLVFGGWTGTAFSNEVWSLSLSATPAWTRLTPDGTPPSPRRHSAVIYDPGHDRMVVFSGFAEGLIHPNDAYTLSLSGTPTWAPLVASNPPPGRNSGRAIYDPVGDRMVMFGGYVDGAGYLNDTWSLSLAGTPAWTEVLPPPPVLAPTPRRDQSAIYDPRRDRLVIFGGWDGNFAGDVWALALAGPVGWTPIATAGPAPPPRTAHAAIYDPVRDEMVIFGGANATFLNDAWALSLADPPTWRQLQSNHSGPDAPSGRNAMSAIYDAPHDRMLIFGGWNGTAYENDTWALSLATGAWERLDGPGRTPSPRRHYLAVRDPAEKLVYLFGGYNGGSTIRQGGYLDDTWALEADADQVRWHELHTGPRGPSPRFSGRGVYDSARERVVMVGGYDDNYLNDVWELRSKPNRWGELVPGGTGPEGRVLHTATYDPVRDRILVFGGEGFLNRRFNDTWAIQFSGGDAARPEPPANTEPATTGGTRLDFALHGVAPNPSRGEFAVAFTLPGDGAARLEVFSIDGRLVTSRDVGTLGPGRHVVQMAEARPLAPGVYLVRLNRGPESLALKTAVMR